MFFSLILFSASQGLSDHIAKKLKKLVRVSLQEFLFLYKNLNLDTRYCVCRSKINQKCTCVGRGILWWIFYVHSVHPYQHFWNRNPRILFCRSYSLITQTFPKGCNNTKFIRHSLHVYTSSCSHEYFLFLLQYFTGHTLYELQMMPPTQYKKSYGYGSSSIHLDDLPLVLSSTIIFWAFFPKLNMMNHSCDPNVRSSVDGAKLSVHAIRDIGKNEAILACYGPHYKLLSKDERLTQLQMEFCFECKCHRCVLNDTTIDKYYEYYCPNDECRSLVDLNGVDSRWWYDYTKRTDKDFTCNECGTRLPVNPTMMQKFEKTAGGYIDKGYTYYSTDNYVITTSLMDLYFDASKCLGAYHELKSRLAHVVLGYRILGEYWMPCSAPKRKR